MNTKTVCILLVSCICIVAVPVFSENDTPYLPGGEEVKKAVEARRGKTELSRLAASMKPGSWAELKTDVPKGIWSSPKVNGGRNKGGSGGLHIAGWTSDAHWDSRTGQFFYMGLRQTRRFIAYSEEKNAWRSIDLDPKSDNPVFRTKYGHIYGTNGFDPERSRFYHYYRPFKSEKENIDLKGGISFFDAVTEKWTKLPDLGSGAMTLEYSSAMDGLIVLTKKPKFFSNKKQTWEEMSASPVDGYHSLMRHNPFRQEILIGGGNHQPNTLARIKKDGTIEKLKDFPFKLSVRGDKLTIDPQTGRYLLWQFGHAKGDKKIYAYELDSDKNEYRVVKKATEFPWSYYTRAYTVTAFIPEYNVIMVANGKTFLYKHDPNGDYPLVTK